MKEKKSLYDSISEVDEGLAEKELRTLRVRRNPWREIQKIRPLFLLGVLVTLLGVKYIHLDGENRIVMNDFRTAAQGLFLEADTLVVDYYNLYGELPPSLPDMSLAPYVNYERLSEIDYALELNYIPYNHRMVREVGTMIYPTDVGKFFNSVIP